MLCTICQSVQFVHFIAQFGIGESGMICQYITSLQIVGLLQLRFLLNANVVHQQSYQA